MSEHQYVVCDYRAVFEKSYMTPPGSVAFFVSRNVIAMVDPNKDDEEPVLSSYWTKFKKNKLNLP